MGEVTYYAMLLSYNSIILRCLISSWNIVIILLYYDNIDYHIVKIVQLGYYGIPRQHNYFVIKSYVVKTIMCIYDYIINNRLFVLTALDYAIIALINTNGIINDIIFQFAM